MAWKNWLVGGLAALASVASVDAQERVRKTPYPGTNNNISSPYQGPERFSVGLHPGLKADRFDLNALELIVPHIDMVRTGNAIHYPNGDPQNSLYRNIVVEDDPYLERVGEMLGWERILMVINDKNDYIGPEITDAINAAETGFIQRTVHAFPQIKYVQIYNEPCNFDKLCGGAYVPHLAAAYNWIKDVENPRRARQNERNKDDPNYVPKAELVVVSAATYGSSAGLVEFCKDLEAGLVHFCDSIGVHDYTGHLALEFANLRTEHGFEDVPLWMTETGIPFWSRHTEWYEQLASMEVDLKKNFEPSNSHNTPWQDNDQHIFWYVFNTGKDTVPGVDQFGIIEPLKNNEWLATNEDMFNAILARPISEYHKAFGPQPVSRRVTPNP